MESPAWDRRGFLRTTAGGLFGLPGILPHVSAEEARPVAEAVKFHREIEPLVRLIEDSPRERLLEDIGSAIHSGAGYREILAALLLAGIRNIQPRPVGFKFHAVLVVHSAHLASLNSPPEDRWLPLFWALDAFKSSQAQDIREGDWTMAAVDEKSVPPADKAAAHFTKAMDEWDEVRVDAALASLARGGQPREIFELFCRYAARDYRDIGHKAIYVANAWRTLRTIGWLHAEPVLRSLGYALLKYNGENPSRRDSLADRPGRKNLIRLREIKANLGKWTPDARHTRSPEMLGALRGEDWDGCAAKVVELLNRGDSVHSLWSAMFESASEIMLRRPGILALHACTTTNALHHLFTRTTSEENRRYLLLQNASFLAFFREDARAMEGLKIDTFDATEPAPDENALEDIFTTLGTDRMLAVRKTLAWLDNGGDPKAFTDTAQRLIYLKGRDSHDYKFSSAIIEDHPFLSPELRNRFLAASVLWFKSAGAPDSPLVARTRSIL